MTAKTVTINGEEYEISGTTYSPARGWEYFLSGSRGVNCRVCAAYPAGTVVHTAGERLVFA